jgi:hypothetical protein
MSQPYNKTQPPTDFVHDRHTIHHPTYSDSITKRNPASNICYRLREDKISVLT